MAKLTLLSSKAVFQVLNSLAKLKKKSTIAFGFSTKSIIKNELPQEYGFIDYLKHLYSTDNRRLPPTSKLRLYSDLILITPSEVAESIS